jgi:hypothetical protein
VEVAGAVVWATLVVETIVVWIVVGVAVKKNIYEIENHTKLI